MATNESNRREGGWGAVLDGVEGANPSAAADAPRHDGWAVIAALVDRSSGGAAAGDLYARVVAQVGAFVPGELRDATETLLRVAGGASSWAGAVIAAAPGPPVAAETPDVASTQASAGPEPEARTEAEPKRNAPTEVAPPPEPHTADVLPDDPTFEAAIAASPPAETRSR